MCVYRHICIANIVKMSTKLCCLCCSPCANDYKCLQNNSGGCNEIYKTTVIYFDPMLLTEDNGTESSKERKVLCHNCWVHIHDFHDFHQTIVKIRSSLEQLNIQKSLQVKVEEEQVATYLNDYCFNNCDEELVQLNEVLCKTDLEGDKNCLEDDFVKSNDDEDEEKPLSKLRKTYMPLKSNKETNNKITNKETRNLNIKGKPQSRKKRKLKERFKNSIKLNSENEEDDDTSLPRNKKNIKEMEKDPGYHPVLEKGREYDEFIAEWKTQLECDICNETFSIFDFLKTHFKDKHNTKGYVKCCERKFDRRCSLVEHIRLHINPEMHKCNICGKLSRSKYNLKIHKKTVHEDSQQFTCDVCPKVFKQKQNLELHLLSHVEGNKDFKCNECEKAYVLEVQLKKHIKIVHNDKRVCDQCGKTLHGIGALKNHLKEHTGIEKPTYPCNECGLELKSTTSLKRHKEAYHNDGSTVYVCSICGKVSATERGLKNHRKYVHEIERKHQCPHCGKAFKRPKNLQEHIATHTGEALYVCSECPRTFKISSKYHEHRKKVHPLEWEEGRKNRLEKQKIDYELVTNQVVI